MINKVVRSSDLGKIRLVLLVRCSLDLGLGRVQAQLLLGGDDGVVDPGVVEGRVDLGLRTPGFGQIRLILLVRCSLGLGLGRVQAQLLLGGEDGVVGPGVVEARIDLEL